MKKQTPIALAILLAIFGLQWASRTYAVYHVSNAGQGYWTHQQIDLTTNAAAALSQTQIVFVGAIVYCDAGNTGNVGIGPTTTANLYSIAAGQWFQIPTASDLSTWYISPSGNQTVHIEYW